jgi:hypothetical protein
MAKLFTLLALLLAGLASCRAEVSLATSSSVVSPDEAGEDIATLKSSGRELTGFETDEEDVIAIKPQEIDLEAQPERTLLGCVLLTQTHKRCVHNAAFCLHCSHSHNSFLLAHTQCCLHTA